MHIPYDEIASMIKGKRLLLILLGAFFLVVLPLITSSFGQKSQEQKQKEPIVLQKGSYLKGQVIVKYKQGQSPKELEEAMTKQNHIEQVLQDTILHQDPKDRLKELNRIDLEMGVIAKEKVFDTNNPTLQGYYLLTLDKESDIATVQKRYLMSNFIEKTQPNGIGELFTAPVNDPYYEAMWNLKKIAIEDAWNATKGSSSIAIAVLDTGIDFTHEDFSRETMINGKDFATCNLIDRTTSRCLEVKQRDDDSKDDNGHGTRVAGIIGAVANNGKGITGIDWTVHLLIVKVVGAGGGSLSTDVAEGIRYAADHEARVISLSLGGIGPCLPVYGSAIQYALSKNVVVVTAAGNDGADTSNYAPANCPGVINVSATDQNDQRAIFNSKESANYGVDVTLSAPGTGIWTTNISSGILYQESQGTSFAAPQVAAVTALLLAKDPSLTPAEIKQCLVANADSLATDLPIGPRLNAKKVLENCHDQKGIPNPTSSLSPTTPPSNPTIQSTPTPPFLSPTPRITSAAYECHEETTTSQTSGLQLKTLVCEPR